MTSNRQNFLKLQFDGLIRKKEMQKWEREKESIALLLPQAIHLKSYSGAFI